MQLDVLLHCENCHQPLPGCVVLHAGLAQEQVRDVVGHLLYFSLLLLLSGATIVICVSKTVKDGRLHSRFLLPAAWAVYNAVGPMLFLCAACLKKSKSLELAMYILSMVRACWSLRLPRVFVHCVLDAPVKTCALGATCRSCCS